MRWEISQSSERTLTHNILIKNKMKGFLYGQAKLKRPITRQVKTYPAITLTPIYLKKF